MNVVLLHAFPLDERMWEMQREVLREHEVVAPNLYFLGSTMDEWAEGVLLNLGKGPFVAVGASMGGYCALALARRARDRIAGLVLAGARADADSPERRAGRADTIRLIDDAGAEALWTSMRPKLFPEDAPAEAVERARTIALDQRPTDLVIAVEAIRDRPDSTEVVKSLPAPLLVVVGEHDPFLSVEEAGATARTAPAGRLVVFEQTGHLPSLQHPERFNAVLVELLSSI
jgi:pimeloyl-ACP methyl ester carboxylesterase